MTRIERHKGGWLSGLVVSALVGLFAWLGGLQALDRAIYDLGVRDFTGLPSSDVVLIEVDQTSIDRLGPWPWPRERYADLLALLEPVEPSVVALALDLTQAEANPLSPVIEDLRQLTGRGALALAGEELERLDELLTDAEAQHPEVVEEIVEHLRFSGLRGQLGADLNSLKQRLELVGADLDPDRRLLASLQSLPAVILPFRFARQDKGTDSTPQVLPAFLERSVLGMVRDPYRPLAGKRLVLPLERFAAASEALGYLQVHPDADRVVRSAPLLVQRQARLLPSFALAAVAGHRQVDLGSLQIDAAGIRLGGLRTPAARELRQRIAFYPNADLRRVSAADILRGQAAVSPFRDKIVVIGPTAASAVAQYPNPRGEGLSAVEIAVHAISNLLQGHALARPAQAQWLEWVVFGLAAFIVIVLLPRLPGAVALFVGLLLAALLLAAEYGVLIGASLWLPLGAGAVLLFAGVLSLLVGRGLAAVEAVPVERVGDPARGENARKPAAAVEAARPEGFGPYQVEQLLNHSGSGTRYLCRDPRLDRRVVVQAFELGLSERELATIKQRFLAEVEQAELLDHPAILPIEQAGESHQQLFVANTYLEGWDLRRIAQPNRLLKVPQALEIAAKCAEALAQAHDRHLTHGEVCPQNIQYAVADKQIKLGGFGTAAVTASLHAQGDRLLQTSFYLSPEYLTGDKVDSRADLFALGVTLYQLLSGQLPFRADTVATLTYRIVNEPHPPIQPLRPEVPDCAVLILDRCLAKNPAERYQDGIALAKDLRVCAHRTLRGQG